MKFFLFKKEDVNEFSVGFTNTGDNLSVLAVPADSVAHMTATPGYVHFTFNNAGLYDHFQGTAREGFSKTKVSVACIEGEEYDLIREVIAFISNTDNKKTTMVFDAVTGQSTFKSASVQVAVTPFLPKQPTIMSTQAISNDPASTDLTQTTTTTLDGVTFTAPTLMPIVDYNPDALSGYTAGDEIGQPNHWNNQGTGGSTYNITTNTDAPLLVDGGSSVGVKDRSVSVDADPENLILDNTLNVEDDYTMYFVTATTAYFSFGHSIVNNGGAYMNIGFAKGSGYENTNSEFWVQHNVQGASLPVKMQLNNTDGGTTSYAYPDPFLEEGTTVWKASEKKPQTCYVFMLRRDKETNLYLHNHLGEIVGYAPANKTGTTGRTDGDLNISQVGTGFRGKLVRLGVIESDIGAAEAARIAKDLHARYAWRY